MIITESLPYNKIKKQLKKTDKIGVISCNACVRLCKTGGENYMNKFVAKLKKDGFKIVDVDLIGNACNYDLLQKSQLHGNVNILLSCDAGEYNIRKLFPKHKIISANKTLGLGVHEGGKKITMVKKIN